MRYEDLVNEKLLSPSIAELLVDERKRQVSLRSTSYLSLAFNAGLLYTVLVQAYVLARSIKEEEKVSDLGYSSTILNNIKDTWSMDCQTEHDFREGKLWVFSFLMQCAREGKTELLEKDSLDILKVVNKALDEANKNTRKRNAPLTEEELLAYLKSLSLLRNTEIDWENMRFIFNTNETVCEIDCQPFICFWNNRQNTRSDVRTNNCYVIISAKKSKQAGELCVSMLPLGSKDSTLKSKQVSWQASHNETIRMILKSLEIPNDWLAIEECWCDLAFIRRLADTVKIVLPKYWNIKGSDKKSLDIRDKLIELFEDQAIQISLSAKKGTNKKIVISDLDNVLFGLFINHGIFKTMRDMFDDPNAHNATNSEKLFMLFLDALVTNEEKQQYLSECDHSITLHINALKAKVPYENSPQFRIRSREIKAEWHAYTILKAAGIQADNLFADKESIYSIDDYYNMIRNPQTTPVDDLKQVLHLLIEIYGALLNNLDPKAINRVKQSYSGYVRIDEDKYYSDIQRIRSEIENETLECLFERFSSIVEKSANNMLVKHILGREHICDLGLIRAFQNDIRDELEKQNKEVLKPSDAQQIPLESNKKIFISYSHEDKDKVQVFVDHWLAKGFNVYIDEERFKNGVSWLTTAQKAIREECAVFVLFVSKHSVVSNAVRAELDCAKEAAVQKYIGDQSMIDRFVQLVNLDEKMTVSKLLKDIILHDPDNLHKDIAHDLQETLLGINKFSTLQDLHSLDNEIREILEYQPPNKEKIRDIQYTDLEQRIAKFYTFLKYGDGEDSDWTTENIDNYFHGIDESAPSLSNCIYPIVASMKETRIHRDNITMVGYETVNGGGDKGTHINYILTSRPLMSPDDYYCIPIRERVGDDCSWMVVPLLISYRRLTGKE